MTNIHPYPRECYEREGPAAARACRTAMAMHELPSSPSYRATHALSTICSTCRRLQVAPAANRSPASRSSRQQDACKSKALGFGSWQVLVRRRAPSRQLPTPWRHRDCTHMGSACCQNDIWGNNESRLDERSGATVHELVPFFGSFIWKSAYLMCREGDLAPYSTLET